MSSRRYPCVLAIALLWLVQIASSVAQDRANEVRWRFHAVEAATPVDAATGVKAALHGHYAYVPGITDDAVRFDGYTTVMSAAAAAIPAAGRDGFTIESWVALNTYPWNWVPLADQQKEHQAGYFLGLDAFGHIGFQASIDGQWRSLTSSETVPLKHWAHVTGSYRANHGDAVLAIYLNGSKLCELVVHGQFSPSQADLLIGRVRQATLPFPEAEVKPAYPIWYSLDGDLGEITLIPRGLGGDEIRRDYEAAHAPPGQVLPETKMPSGPSGSGTFGAYYTSLQYESGWDRLRRVGEDSDVIIRLDNSPVRMVFWQGLNYVPAWVTGDDKWYTDEFLEVWDAGCPDHGDCEPMSDKQVRFSRVTILETNSVRAVVHWRYALVEAVGQKGAWPDADTGWYDWADEYWTVYSDGVAIRRQVLHSRQTHAVHEWQETIVLHQPGHTPEADISDAAITLENMAGVKKTYTWKPKTDTAFTDPVGPPDDPGLKSPNIQLVNLKSAWRPFQIVPPQGASADFYNNEKSFFEFECWNHWPVAQIASSDRPCVSSDRPSHTSLSHLFWQTSAETDDTATKLLMDGLTTQSPESLLPLARSWITPATLQLEGSKAVSGLYDQAQRAYLIDGAGEPKEIRMTLLASTEQPVFHPAFVLNGWGDGDVKLLVNGKRLPAKEYRLAHVAKLDSTDLLISLPLETTQTTQIRLIRASAGHSIVVR